MFWDNQTYAIAVTLPHVMHASQDHSPFFSFSDLQEHPCKSETCFFFMSQILIHRKFNIVLTCMYTEKGSHMLFMLKDLCNLLHTHTS